MELPFATLDVFTTKKFEGNPLAIVRIPASLRGQLTQSTKQKIASEFNLSETVFLHDDTSKSGSEARDIDIFTALREIPFAGHPTIGSAVFVRHHLLPGTGTGTEAVRALVTKAGRIELEPLASLPRGIQAKIPHDVRLHTTTLRSALASATRETATQLESGLHTTTNPAICAAELDAPIFSIVNGMTFVLVRLASLEQLREVKSSRLDVDMLVADFLDEGWRDSLVGRYYYVDVDEDGNEKEVGSDDEGGKDEGARYLRTRMMGEGIEDPATGSAASALSAYLTLTREKASRAFRITQGVEMGRRSVISVETTAVKEDGDEVKLADVKLGGTAVVVMQGTLTVDEE